MDNAEPQKYISNYEPGTDQDMDAGLVWHTVIVTTLVTILVVLLLKVLFFKADKQEHIDKNYPIAYQPLAELKGKQLGQISMYGWRDSTKGVLSIPIGLAMLLTVQEYAAGRTDPPMAIQAAPLPSEGNAAATATTATEQPSGAGQPIASGNEEGHATAEDHSPPSKEQQP